MACSTDTLKFFAFVWDAMYALLALLVTLVGAFILIKFGSFALVGYSLVGCGAIVFLLLIIGILGAVRDSSRMLKTFAVILLILAVLHIFLIACFLAFKTTFLIKADKAFDELWREQPTPIIPGNSTQIAGLERWLDCCGNSGPKDYVLPPHTCYEAKTDKLSLEGCRQKFVDFISESWLFLNIFVFIFVVVEIICATFSYVLANSILNRWRRSKYFPK